MRLLRVQRLALLAVILVVAACGSTVQRTVGANGARLDDQSLSVPDVGEDRTGTTVDPGAQTPTAAVGNEPGGSAAAPADGAGKTPVRSAVRITSPLEIGLTYIDNSGASSQLGASDPRTATPRTVGQGFVKAFNAAGGVNGRKLRAVEYVWNVQNGNWSSDAAAACERFTVDHKLKVVLDFAFGQIGGFRDCLQKHGVFQITTQDEGDRISAAQAPLHANPTGTTHDRSYGAVVKELFATRYLSRNNQVGVIIEDCPEVNRAWSRTLLPLTKQLGLKAPKEARIDCTTGFTSAGPASAAIGNAILRFRSPPAADRVMFVSAQEAVVLLLFGPQASSQGYYPGYMLSSSAQAMLFPDQPFPDDQLPQLHGAGSSPYVDTSNAKQTAIDQRCLRMIRSVGVAPENYTDVGQVIFLCGGFMLLEAALKRTNGDSVPSNLAAAVASLGGSFAAPGAIDSSSRFSRTKHDGGHLVRAFGYVASCDCLRYSGKAVPAPN